MNYECGFAVVNNGKHCMINGHCVICKLKENEMNSVKDETFNELKTEAIKIWNTYDNQFGYADEKIDYLNSFNNVKDNFGTIIGMFDSTNQLKLYNAVSLEESRQAIRYWTGGSL